MSIEKYQHGGGANFGWMDETPTPRTDAARFEALRDSAFRWDCITLKLGQELERELNASKDEYCKTAFALTEQIERAERAKAEVKEIRAALGDDGRRTHKELIELATKASQWRTWKQKYIDLRNAHIAEGQDPAGTIWEHADKLQKELKETKAEVAKLNHQLIKTESDLLQSQDINSFLDAEFRIACKRAEKAEAESESRRQSLAFALNEIKKAEAEVERLRSILKDHATFLRKNGFENQANLLDPTK